MANRVVKESYGNSQEILKFNEFIACPVTVSDTGLATDGDGNKIVRAGTVIGGDYKKVLENPGEVVVDKVTSGVKATKTIGTTTSGIVYTAKVAGMSLGITYAFDDDFNQKNPMLADNQNNYAVSIVYGDPSFKKGNSYLSLAYADGLNLLEATRVVAGVSISSIKVGAIYQYSKSSIYEKNWKYSSSSW